MYKPAILNCWTIPKKLALLLVFVFLSASAILVTSDLMHRRHEIWEAGRYALFSVQSLAAQQEQITIGTKQMLSTLAQSPEVQSLDASACGILFRQLNDRYPFYSIIAAATPGGNIFAASIPFDPATNLSDRKHFADVLRTREFSAGEYVVGRVSELHTLHFSYPVLDSHKNLVCVVLAGFRLDGYAHYIAKANLPENSAVVIIDHAGKRLYRLPENGDAIPGKPIPNEVFALLSHSVGEGAYEKLADDGVNRLYAFKQLRLEEASAPYMYIAVGISKAEVLRKVNRATLVSLSILGFSALLVMSLAWFLGKYTFIRPINRLVEASQRFGRGELGTRSELPHGNDELGELARSFDNMASLLELRDVERRTAEIALRESEERYRQLFNGCNDAIFVYENSAIGFQGRFLAVNDIACQRLGYSREELLGMNLQDINAPDNLPDVPGLLRQLTAHGRVMREGVHVARDGRRIPVEIIDRLFEFDGISAILSTVRDISERKAADKALLLTFFSLEHAFDPMYWVGPAGQILYANEAACRSLGYSKEELLLMCVTDIDSNLRAEEWSQLNERWKQGTGLSFESVHRRKDGGTFPVEANINTLVSEEKGFNFITVKDISERKRVAAERERLESQLSHARKMESIGRLAGGVAHDFNNMLGVIIGRAEIALENTDPAEPLHYELKEILKAAGRSAELTRQLLAFARKQIVSPRILDLSDGVSATLGMLRRLVGKNIALVWQPASNLWKVRLDPAQLDQILANLAANARDAIPDTGTLKLKTANVVLDEAFCTGNPAFRPGQYVQLSVKDTGAGMSREVLDNIFEPFFTTKAFGQGTGLGLATVYGIVEQNGGFIAVSSEPGCGATFDIYLPGIATEATQAESSAMECSPHQGSGAILLVEDEEPFLQLAKTILQRLGYTVLPARTPGEAIRIAEKAVDLRLLITDMVMPEMNGKDLALRLCAIKPGLRCIYMSGYSADIIDSGEWTNKEIHFIQKPFSIRQMSETVQQVLGQA